MMAARFLDVFLILPTIFKVLSVRDPAYHETKSSLSEIVQNALRFFLVGGITAAWSSGIIAAWSGGIIAARLLPVRSNS